ncbi:hydantoinase/oxoprolinase family protein [Nocardioides sp. GY 10113]|nr:hydantoinase/oxoprolinase family protein [Nocardioides sp. GY 10113]
MRIGIDVGGTHTDAVVLDELDTVLAWTKQATTRDVTTGLGRAVEAVLAELGPRRSRVGRVMLGTTHATNAILERHDLGRVAVVRLGAPATTAVPPLQAWPADLRRAVLLDAVVAGGGHLVDGYPIAPLDTEAIRTFLRSVAGRADAIAVTGVFSPAFRDQELEVAGLVAEELGEDVPVSLSHEIGSLGLVERENATVLNASLYGVARGVTQALAAVLEQHGLDVTSYFAQNDGTLMAPDFAARYPVLTIGSGPANSLRGAAFLSGVSDAIVVDVGGTSSDLGVLVGGFPRESALAVDIGGVRTNFRMPDILGVAIGGGTRIRGEVPDVTVGPDSVGYALTEEGLSFGGAVPTLTDAALSEGRTEIEGTVSLADHAAVKVLAAALARSDDAIEEAVDLVSLGKTSQPLVAVGGGSFLVPDDLPGVSKVLRPRYGQVANAVGAAIAMASGRWETIVPAGPGRADALEEAKQIACQRAIQAGAEPSRVEVVELTEVPLSYLPEPALRVHVKAAGPLGRI